MDRIATEEKYIPIGGSRGLSRPLSIRILSFLSFWKVAVADLVSHIREIEDPPLIRHLMILQKLTEIRSQLYIHYN